MIRAVGYLLSEFVWSLVFRILPQHLEQDEDPDTTATQVAARTQWIRDRLPPDRR